MEPVDASNQFFAPRKKINGRRERHFRLSYSIDTTNTVIMDRVGEIHRKYREGIHDIRYKRHPQPEQGRVTLRGRLDALQLRTLSSELASVGAHNIRTHALLSAVATFVGIALLVTLWGLDPVFAQLLLNGGVGPIELTIIRFMTFWSFAAVIFGAQYLYSGQQFKKIDPFHPDLVLSGIALFATGLATYLTLVYLSPTQYIIFIIGGVLVMSFLRHKISWYTLVSLGVSAIILIILSRIYTWSLHGFLWAIVSAVGFALYSGVSRRYQEQRVLIRNRYPAFLFWIASTCLLLSLCLIPFSELQLLPASRIVETVLFSSIFITLPYVLYFEYMKRMQASVLNQLLPFVCLATIIGEALLFRSWTPLVGLALPMLFAAPYFFSRPFATR